MTYTEFKRHLGKAGVSVGQYASLFGVRQNSISNYAKKDCVPRYHAISAILLGDSQDRGVNPLVVLARYGISPSAENVRRLADYRDTRKHQ